MKTKAGSNKLKRRAGIIVTFCVTALLMIYLSYKIPRLLPGDFITAMYGSSNVTLTAQQETELKAYYNEDRGFLHYLIKILSLDWGYSYAFLTPVAPLFFSALPWTILLMGSAHIISTLVGFIGGVEAVWRQNSRFEKWMVGGMTLLEGIPEICSGVILLVIFALHLQWFPASGAETAYAQNAFFERIFDVGHHLVLPLLTLVLAYVPGNFLLTRNSMIMVIKAQFIITAKAKGIPPLKIRYKHAARNALLPVVTRFGLRFAFMITGALVVERINSYPGLGTLLFNAIQARDLPVIQAVVLASSVMVLAVILGMEYTYRLIDPRIGNAR